MLQKMKQSVYGNVTTLNIRHVNYYFMHRTYKWLFLWMILFCIKSILLNILRARCKQVMFQFIYSSKVIALIIVYESLHTAPHMTHTKGYGVTCPPTLVVRWPDAICRTWNIYNKLYIPHCICQFSVNNNGLSGIDCYLMALVARIRTYSDTRL